MYIHQLENWPQFTYSKEQVAGTIHAINNLEIKLKSLISVVGLEQTQQIELENMTIEIVKNFEIEAVRLNADDVRSSILKRIGLATSLTPTKRNIDGYVEATLDALKNGHFQLSDERLIKWHSCIFHTGKNEHGIDIVLGKYRDGNDGKMTVSSGMLGKEKIHFIAPAGEIVNNEMNAFVLWYQSENDLNPIIKSAIAHLYFITIHPFNDGNGRLARIISDMVLAKHQSLKYYSISEQIQSHKKEYYTILEKTQKQNSLDITLFIGWYLDMIFMALKVTEERIIKLFVEVNFYDRHRLIAFNIRQKTIINALFKAEIFNKLNTTKYAKFFNISKETASRDLIDLYKKDILQKLPAGGRETSYYLPDINIPDEAALGKQKQKGN